MNRYRNNVLTQVYRLLFVSVITVLTAGSMYAQVSPTATVAPGDTVTIGTLGDELAYDVVEVRAEAGSEITVAFANYSAGMPHNVVFVNGESDINPVGIAALQASKDQYVPQGELDRMFGYTTLAGPGETVYVTITVPEEPGSYPYICTYPGHFTVMQGILVAR